MQYRFEWTISTENYRDIMCTVEHSFAGFKTADGFAHELLNSTGASCITLKCGAWRQYFYPIGSC